MIAKLLSTILQRPFLREFIQIVELCYCLLRLCNMSWYSRTTYFVVGLLLDFLDPYDCVKDVAMIRIC